MRLVVTPAAFKESLTAAEAAAAIVRGFRDVFPSATFVEKPLGDGGPGTMDALLSALDGHIRTVIVRGPLGNPISADYGITGDGSTAVIEMARAAGMELIPPDRRNPLVTSTFGVGELIIDAVRQGVSRVIVALGGSGTVDGGTGMARALGVRFLDERGDELPEGGGSLDKLFSIDATEVARELDSVRIEGACDVTNPLCGPHGAARVFAPQKGATADMVERLERGLERLADIVDRDLGVAVGNVPGSGSAGGLGAGLVGFLGARLRSGIDLVIDAIDLEKEIIQADLVITGEGRLDEQTAMGKAVSGVANLARRHGVPVVAVCGGVSDNAETALEGVLDAVIPIPPRPASMSESIRNAAAWTESAARRLARIMRHVRCREM